MTLSEGAYAAEERLSLWQTDDVSAPFVVIRVVHGATVERRSRVAFCTAFCYVQHETYVVWIQEFGRTQVAAPAVDAEGIARGGGIRESLDRPDNESYRAKEKKKAGSAETICGIFGDHGKNFFLRNRCLPKVQDGFSAISTMLANGIDYFEGSYTIASIGNDPKAPSTEDVSSPHLLDEWLGLACYPPAFCRHGGTTQQFPRGGCTSKGCLQAFCVSASCDFSRDLWITGIEICVGLRERVN